VSGCVLGIGAVLGIRIGTSTSKPSPGPNPPQALFAVAAIALGGYYSWHDDANTSRIRRWMPLTCTALQVALTRDQTLALAPNLPLTLTLTPSPALAPTLSAAGGQLVRHLHVLVQAVAPAHRPDRTTMGQRLARAATLALTQTLTLTLTLALVSPGLPASSWAPCGTRPHTPRSRPRSSGSTRPTLRST
jgi:hypothetical protein